MNSPPPDLGAWIDALLAPAWAARAIQPGIPGYVEWLTPDGAPTPRTVKTTLVTARLIYVFSHASLLDPTGPGLPAARHGVDFLWSRCGRQDGAYHHAVEPDGAVVDGRADLYDLAFVIFALAWYHRASGDRRALLRAEETMCFIEARLAHPAGGFAEDDSGTLPSDGTLPRRQNPHMHLLEACHAMAEAAGGRDAVGDRASREADAHKTRWLERADRLVALMRERLFDHETGTLGEFFGADWTPAPGAAGALREPGHHFEWVWLLLHHHRLTGRDDVRPVAERLYAFAMAHGLEALPDGSHAALDGIDRSGRPIARTRLLWPQTEALKAHAARLELLEDPDAARRLDDHLTLIFRHYVDPASGRWFNQLGVDGRPVQAELPVRVLYHLMLALSDASRVKALART